jgi:hypothetical protein
MAPQMWLFVSFLVLTLYLVADRILRARRRSEARARRQWFEYAMLAARSAEEMRGR